MYPRLIEIPLPFEIFGVSTFTIYSFGAMLAVAFLVAAWLARLELDRLYRRGEIKGVRVEIPQEAAQGKKKRGGKKKGGKPRTTIQEVSPSYFIGTLTIVAVVAGVAGSKLFHILENLDDFARDPMGMIFSVGGLTFYGGLIMAALGIAWYVRKKGLSLATFSDAALPTVLLAYGIGRIGCHLAGDGDWGIEANLALKPDWIPTFLWAETYPNNILNVTLPAGGVYPTPLYEFLMCAVLFGILWALRTHPFKRGWLTSLTLLFFGVERLLIEQIRVNNTFDVFGMVVTQAEVISTILILVGGTGLVLTTRKRAAAPSDNEASAVPSSAV